MAKQRLGKREREQLRQRLAQQAAAPKHDRTWRARSCLDVVPCTDWGSDFRRIHEGDKRRPEAAKRPTVERTTIVLHRKPMITLER